MEVICDVLENANNDVVLYLANNGNILLKLQCKQVNFCENLPSMMKQILEMVLNNNFKTKINFDINKHLTTFRIFKSFIIGITTK